MVPPEWLSSWIQLVAPLISAGLTLVLVYLYREQKNLIAADHRPILEVVDYSFDEDDATVELVNHGNGVATNVTLVTLMYTDNGEHKYCSVYRHRMTRTDNTSSNSLGPTGDVIEYEGKSKIKKRFNIRGQSEFRSVSFSSALSHFERTGAESVKFIHVVDADDLVGKPVRAPLYRITREVNLNNIDNYSVGSIQQVRMDTEDYTFDPYFKYPSLWQRLAQTIHLKCAKVVGSDYRSVSKWWKRNASGLSRVKKKTRIDSRWGIIPYFSRD
ncbi:hypothetical protein PN419_00035 [Halorubrum ezzemoulense]|uniref:hypothetical protein n=1 Tax=Halorubrum ezzemoulense TaxID=337243 RepID=UPI00232F00B5|nr:hypothetical protein [Halorubrum ezzemoulense]MDB9247395.1 hypothetical protein [Halorubrum ezzemoulense]MDB9258696.1 hypothetical protein [Halorubrum ezzemoulense]MDB9261052.1 hypothetical protein [Halorubrum ezzemoulense]MDB9264446.1 hypothetical protein [Halorubrum ezzemoulense]MDB9269057.1 hypothetical protein [Halorubrum ezzemoulense]